MMVISDGAPVDDSTLSVQFRQLSGTPSARVIEDIENKCRWS